MTVKQSEGSVFSLQWARALQIAQLLPSTPAHAEEVLELVREILASKAKNQPAA